MSTPRSSIDRRRSIRLHGYDYRQHGAYFVTICTHNRTPLFGEIIDDEMVLNEAGQAVRKCWAAIPDHYPHAKTDAFIMMPNHVHGIILIDGNVSDSHRGGRVGVGANNYSPLQPTEPQFRSPSKTLGSIIRGFKIGVTKWFRSNTDISIVWQRNYYEHVIRDEISLHDIRNYIIHNPAKWHDDPEKPRNSRTPQ